MMRLRISNSALLFTCLILLVVGSINIRAEADDGISILDPVGMQLHNMSDGL